MIYHKLIHGNMLNNYDLGETSLEEALKQGYKPLVTDKKPDESKEYYFHYVEEDNCIRIVWDEEIKSFVESKELEE